jgi:hypothetical protein
MVRCSSCVTAARGVPARFPSTHRLHKEMSHSKLGLGPSRNIQFRESLGEWHIYSNISERLVNVYSSSLSANYKNPHCDSFLLAVFSVDAGGAAARAFALVAGR